ncbi:DNA-processing protein DprA [Lapidilactobacillus wuchangensis]|uniref:DNA-processing protein DprA n=1 Tax=Lapidilactobacillus wuchangensis TaxID=2486001 RepID=UPI000F77A431|nr:DNA-processing protein DprA [Lapidilactobacillus wuchangensis]
MDKNSILLAASLNSKWSYREQLQLARLLQDYSGTIPNNWAQLNSWLQQQWSTLLLPAELQSPQFVGNYLTVLDQDYPLALAETYQPPLLLFYAGHRELLATPKLAIVGARECTTYSHVCLRRLIPQLVDAKITTVSGLAAGVDQLVHQETLLAHGATISVIGTGLDVYYPTQNELLQQLIGQQGLLLSEYPPATPPRRFHFPQRNRIIAGLSAGVLVTEARQRSGSLITANLGLQENRNIYALPGSLLSPLSEGTNQLLQAGATPVLSAMDIIRDFNEVKKMQPS